jgi:signal transduction histidine kinase
MNDFAAVVLMICADSNLAKGYLAALSAPLKNVQLTLVTNIPQARHMLERLSPGVILLDESAFDLQGVDTWKQVVVSFSDHAPVVVAATARHQATFTCLIGTGEVEIVIREGNFAPQVWRAVVHSLRGDARSGVNEVSSLDCESFGELLRHEMNNPLTGILGNAELLLEKRHRLPPTAVTQIETIAQLAMRLRETVQRLSAMWESARDSQYTS